MRATGWISGSDTDRINSLLVDGKALPMRPRPHRRVGKWAVGSQGRVLNRWLLQLNAAPMDERFPVPGFGRLAVRKRVCRTLRSAGGERSLSVLPVTAVSSLSSDHRRFDVHWFDLPQLEQIDILLPGWRSEALGPGFGRVIELDSGEVLDLTEIWNTETGLRRYRNILPASGLLGPAAEDGLPLFTVQRVPAQVNPRGSLRALLNPASPLTARNHLTIRNAHDPRAPAALVTVAAHPGIPVGSIALDRPIRDGLGLELCEQVTAEPCRMPVKRPLDWILRRLIGRRCFVYCRVQRADTNTSAQGVATVDHLVLDLLGVAPGDTVTIDGIPEPGVNESARDGMPRVPTLQVKAFPTPADIRARREQLSGGTDGRFPAAEDALGTYPDLPWIFLDQDTRATLGLNYGSKHLGDLKLGVVRLGAARRYQVLKDFREVALLLALAGVPILVALPDWLRWAGSAALVTLALANARWRLAQRLGRGG